MKGMNYNKEIPFERLVPKGRFEFGVDEEPNPDPFKSNISLQQMEGGKRDIEMKMRRMQDVKKIKKLKEKNFPQAMDMINKINEGTISHNRKLILPEPQINDEELQSLAKFSTGIDEENINTTSNTLVGEYRDRGPTPVTMRTPTLEDNIMKQAQNAAILREADTPLIVLYCLSNSEIMF
jgi:pre-mRNA-splicing factor CDC5/CEF1